MNDSQKIARAEALQAAAEWLVRLSDHDLADREIDAWNAWMEASALHVQAFEDVHLLWDAAGDVGSGRVLAEIGSKEDPAASVAEQRAAPTNPAFDASSVTAAAFQPRSTTARVSASRRGPRLRRWGALAATVATLAVAVGVLNYRTLSPPEEIRLTSALGSPRQIALPDGSSIELDAASQVVVQFSSQRRQLELVRGQAYFSVAKDPTRPFEVRAGGALAQALGTHFSVAKRSDSVRVVVTEGHVQVSDLRANPGGIANKVVQLTADQGATLFEGGALKGPVPVDSGSAIAWLQGKVIYRSESLGNVVADLNRYSQARVVLGDERLARLRVTGRWSTADSDSWLESIAQALSLSVVRRKSDILLVSSGASSSLPNRQDPAPRDPPVSRR